jgi:hypothetical protein
MLALSPWSIQLSRGAFEANLVTFYLPLSIYLYLTKRYTLSIIILALNFYSYHSARLLTLLVIPILVFYCRPNKLNIKHLILSLILFLPGLISLFGPSLIRGADIAIWSPTDNWHSVAERRFFAKISGLPDPIARFFSNKITSLTSLFVKNYLAYPSPQFLFTTGAGEGTYGIIPGRGLLYYVELPLLIAFLIILIRHPQKSHFLLLAFLLISPLPAALTKGPGYAANRAIPMLPFLIIMCSSGLVYLLKQFQNQKILAVCIVTISYLISHIFFLEDYLFHSPKSLAMSMNAGVEEVLDRGFKLAQSDPVQISRSLSEPHIYVAFYQKLDPVTYQADISRFSDFDKSGFKFLDQLGKYEIANIHFGNLDFNSPTPRTILIGRPHDFPASHPEHFHIDYPNGETAFKVSQISP